eukprot:6856303-Pyramimonas_sp.AAC.1
MVSPAVAKLVDRTAAVTTWPHRPRKPAQLHFKAGVSGIKQLVYQTHQRLPRELPVGPPPQPPSWDVPRAMAEEANRSASQDASWKESLVPRSKNKGLKGLPPPAKWVSVLAEPRRKPEDDELVLEGWTWLASRSPVRGAQGSRETRLDRSPGHPGHVQHVRQPTPALQWRRLVGEAGRHRRSCRAVSRVSASGLN